MRAIRLALLSATSLLLALGSASASADKLLGIYAGFGSWSQHYSGDVAGGGEEIDIEGDFDLSTKGNTLMYFALEHPVPVLPNVRLQRVDLATRGNNVIVRDFDWLGATYVASESVATNIDIKQYDGIAYYELLDNVVSLDLGLAARYIDGSIDVRSETASGEANFKGVLPMVYGRARVDLPFSGFWLAAEGQGIGYDHHHIIDANAHLGWESSIGLGVEAGWRMTQLKLGTIDDLDSADIRITGPYAALNYHF